MRKIKIFLASSVGELKLDRLAISEMTLELNDELIDQNMRVQLFMCEHFDTSIAMDGKQKEYNSFIRQPCDLFINLYCNKLGGYTLEEYQIALDTRQKHALPHMFIFAKDEALEVSSDLQDFYSKAQANDVSVTHYRTLDEIAHLYRQTVMSYISRQA